MKEKQFQNILKGRFNAGFEIEACIFNQDRQNANEFCRAVRRLNGKHGQIHIGTDRSIKPLRGDWTCESRTPVMRVNASLGLLQRLFDLVAEYGYTNKSCGFHANLSPVNAKEVDLINPFWLAEQSLWAEIRKAFGRDKNKYCQDIALRKDIRQDPALVLKQPVEKRGLKNGVFWDGFRNQEVSVNYKHINAVSLWRYMIQLQDFKKFKNQKLVKCHWHYAGINFENLLPVYHPESRIEIRSFGNKDYHLRLEEICYYLDKAIALIEESYKKPVKI